MTGTEDNGMEWKVHYKGTEPQKIESVKMSLTVNLDGNTAVFDDPMMVMFSDDAMDQFVENVLSLPFVDDACREYHEAYENYAEDTEVSDD